MLYMIIFLFAIVGCNKEVSNEIVKEYGSVTDLDGNLYLTVKIGEQWWMAENLAVTKFNDGTPIIYIALSEADSIWSNANEPSYTFINDSIFGNLYNGKVVLSEKNIAPLGWHIPTDEEWKKLEKTIGMADSELNQTGWRGDSEAEILTSKNSFGWPTGGVLFGSDLYGFNALPGGCRVFNGVTNIYSKTAFWWSRSTAENDIWYRYIDLNEKRIFRHFTFPKYGMSIRCVKD